jgi:hypothetical protein
MSATDAHHSSANVNKIASEKHDEISGHLDNLWTMIKNRLGCNQRRMRHRTHHTKRANNNTYTGRFIDPYMATCTESATTDMLRKWIILIKIARVALYMNLDYTTVRNAVDQVLTQKGYPLVRSNKTRNKNSKNTNARNHSHGQWPKK